ncbi:MAG TPA: SWIM zinc finger family protein [Streptosporangiaceae bacterium]
MATTLEFTEADIRRAAQPRSFERGLGYLDAVSDLRIHGTEITATVHGRGRYRVSLTFGDGGLSGDCSCPHGVEGFFCKHCVAVGLAALELGDELPLRMAEAQNERQALQSWLDSLSREELLAELRGLLDEDPELRRRFELRAATVNADTMAVRSAVRELIALSRRDYIDYDQAYDYAGKVSEAATAIEALTNAGAAEEAIGIAREAIALLADACGSVDDSGGWVGGAAYVLLRVHLRACVAAPPDPVSLGDYLADLLLHDDYGFEPGLEDYADLLGDQGTATVRERIAAAYAANPQDWRAKNLMESMAKAYGDVDAVIAIYSADLDDRGWNHLRIAQDLDEAGRGDEALEWAERGVREAPHPDYRLVDYLADRYAAAGRAHDVLSLRRERFQAERTLPSYQALRQAATDNGVWLTERAEARALLRGDLPRPGARGPQTLASWAWGGPVLVDALLDDGDLDAAWTAAAGVATQAQLLHLAKASIAARPADALAVYLRAIEPLRSQTGDRVYQEMASFLLSARACHEALGSTGEFTRYLTALRADQKRKRNLMKILDESGL